MSHHYSGPDFGFPRGDARLDFTDLYAFPKPGNASKSILVMNVHPSAVVKPPGPSLPSPSRPRLFTRSGSTRTAMRSPTSLTGCDSRSPTTGPRPPRCAERRVHRPPGWATAARLSSNQHGFRRVGTHT